MKISELINLLKELTPEQQEQPARVASEKFSGILGNLWIADEDMVNPSGDGVEPISVYEDADDFEEIKQEVVLPKGSIVLFLDD